MKEKQTKEHPCEHWLFYSVLLPWYHQQQQQTNSTGMNIAVRLDTTVLKVCIYVIQNSLILCFGSVVCMHVCVCVVQYLPALRVEGWCLTNNCRSLYVGHMCEKYVFISHPRVALVFFGAYICTCVYGL